MPESATPAVPNSSQDAPTPPIAATTPRPNGLTDEQVKELFAVAGRRKGDPSMDRLMEEVDKYREQLRQEEIAAQEAAGWDK